MSVLPTDLNVLLAAELMVLFVVFSERFLSNTFLANLPSVAGSPFGAVAGSSLGDSFLMSRGGGLMWRRGSGRVLAFTLPNQMGSDELSPIDSEHVLDEKKKAPLFLTVEKSCLQNQKPVIRKAKQQCN